MSITPENLPIPVQIKAAEHIPNTILNLRLQFDPQNLTNSSNILHAYIDELFSYTYDQKDNASSVNELLEVAKSLPLFKDVEGPVWYKYNVELKLWSIYDEIVVAVYTLNIIYILNTIELLTSTLRSTDVSIENWQRCNNYLKFSYGYLKSLKDFISPPHSSNFNLGISLAEFYIQLIIIIKNIWDVQTQVNNSMGRLNDVPKNVSTYIRILVFMNNELKVISSMNNQKNKLWKQTLDVLLCYYLGLKEWDDNCVGNAVSYIQCGLVLSLEQGEIRGKFKDSLKKLHINNQKQRSVVREKELFMNDVKVERSFRNVPLLEQTLEVVVKLLRILFIKFSKINETLAFEQLISVQEIQVNYLFSSTNLPSGLKVPLKNFKLYVPTKLNIKDSNKQAYF